MKCKHGIHPKSNCDECRKEYQKGRLLYVRAYRKKNAEHIKEYSKRWYKKFKHGNKM